MRLSLIVSLWLGLFMAGSAFGRLEAFPGLDTVIKEADLVAIIRVRRNLNYETGGLGSARYSASECLIQCILKGTATTGSLSVLLLRPPLISNPNAPVQADGYYLVFLKRHAEPSDGMMYHSLDYPACVLPLAWGTGEKFKPTGNVKEDVKALIREYLRWRDEFIQVETKGLERILSQ